MAKKTIKKKKKVLYAYPGLSVPPADPYANMDPYTRQALGLPPVQQTMAGEAPPTGDSMGDSMAGGSPMTGIASAASEAGRAAGVAASDLFAVGLPLLNSLIPDNNKQKRPTPQMAYNPHPYGTGSSALYASGGDIISPLRSGELRVEDNQFSYLSPETINLGGDYHSEGGTNLQYGGNIVEAERGEPVSIGEDGQAVVWGNMYLPGTNKKFKSVAKKIAKEEAKNTNLLGKATKLLQTSNPYNAYEALSFSSGEVINKAAKLREESVRAEKDALANLQQSLLDYAELTGQKPEKISKQFKKGGKMPCLDCGGEVMKKGGKVDPIYVNSKNHPRYKAYQDSLSAYKMGQVNESRLEPGELIRKEKYDRESGYIYNSDAGDKMTDNPFPNIEPDYAMRFTYDGSEHNQRGMLRAHYKEPIQPVEIAPRRPATKQLGRLSSNNINFTPPTPQARNINPSLAQPSDGVPVQGDPNMFQYWQGNRPKGYAFEDGGFIPVAGDEFNIAAYPNFPPEYPESLEEAKDGKWIQKAVNPKHKGYCTPMTKKTCTPRRKALARTFKKHHGFHENGGEIYDDGGNVTRVRNEGKIKITEEIPQSILDAQMRAQMPQALDNQLATQQFMPQARPIAPVHVQPSQDIVYEKLTTADGRPLYAPKFPKNWSKKKIQNTWNNIPNMIGGREVLKGSSWQDVQQVPGWQYSDTTGSRFLPNVARPEYSPNNFRPAFSKLANGGTIEDIQEGQEVDLTPEEYAYLQSIGYSFE